MSKSKPPTKPWVGTLGALVAKALSERTHRLFLYEQGGPYASGLTGIVFNERELRDVRSPVETDKADFRFGFAIWREPHESQGWIAYGGFAMWNKALARVRFMQNVRDNAATIGERILAWLGHHGRKAFVEFDQENNKSFSQDMNRGFDLSEELQLYGDLDRKSTGKHKDRSGSHVGSRFRVMRFLPELFGLSKPVAQTPSEKGRLIA